MITQTFGTQKNCDGNCDGRSDLGATLGAAREGKMAPDFLEAKPDRALIILIVSAVDQKAENSNSVFSMV